MREKLDFFQEKRKQMVYDIRVKYGLKFSDVASVMLQIPREKLVPKEYKNIAYEDNPVPIGYGQTMSQPYTVAFMTSLLDLMGDEKVLEIGTGSGYQTAVLSKLAKEVYSIEIVPELARRSSRILKRLGYKNIHIKSGNGEFGWEKVSPFEAIIVTAGIEGEVPKRLIKQLKTNGVLVAPVGDKQNKVMFRFVKKSNGKITKEKFGDFRFVPFVKDKSN